MNPIVIADASAVLAYLGSERGGDAVDKHLPQIAISSVNLAEVVTVLTKRGVSAVWIETNVLRVFPNVIAFDRDLACQAGLLTGATKQLGLSLGDHACLVTAIALKATVFTTDTAWRKLDVGVEIRLLR